MAPARKARSLKIIVPRQNAHRLGPSLTAEVYAIAKKDGVNVQLPPPVQEQPSSAGPSSENASEWNSLLIAARAQRGPQWDVGTQQFLVEKDSELYYDPTLLLEAARSVASEGRDTNTMPPPDKHATIALHQQQQQHHHQQQQRNTYQGQNQQYPYAGMGNMPMNPSTPQRAMSYSGGSPMNSGGPAHAQYYGDNNMTPTRPGPSVMMDGVGQSPDMYGRRITRGMSEGYQQAYGN